MLLYMIRHGQSEANIRGCITGCRIQVALTEKGIEDAKKAGEKISGIKFDRVYASDSKRAIQTSENAIPGCEPVLDKRLCELDCGILEGLTASEAREKYGDEEYFNAIRNHDASKFGGENIRDHRARMRDFAKLLETENIETVAVFTHEGTMRRMHEIVMGIEGCTDVRWDNGSVCIFEYDGEKWSLKDRDL